MADEKIPETLLKYYKCDQFSLSVLKDKKIWASNPQMFNDPFDCAIQFWSIENFPREYVIDQLNEIDPFNKHSALSNFSLREIYFKGFLEMFGLFCVNPGDNKDLFWGYYNDHRGFAIKFKTKELQREWPFELKKINYKTTRELIDEKVFFTQDKKINTKNAKHWFTIKKDEWILENEWRFIFVLNPHLSEPRKIDYDPNSVHEIILGYRFFEGTESEYKLKGKFKFTFKVTKEENYNLKIMETLGKYPRYPLRQVVLTEDFGLYELPISIEEINGNEVTIIRHLPEEQLKIMDSER